MKTIPKDHQQLFERYLSFHEDLFKVQLKNMQRLVAVVSFKKLNQIDVDENIRSAQPIITPQNLLIEEKELEEIFDEILPVIQKFYNNNKDIKRLEDLNDKRKFSLKELLQNILTRDDKFWQQLSKDLKLSQKLLIKVGEFISTPYLELCAEYFNKKLQQYKWDQPICPICGYPPVMALFNSDKNERTLWCHLCDTEWKFNSHLCPFCLNDDLKQVKYIFPPDQSPNRIDACDKCKHYIKTIDDELNPKKTNFSVDYLATYYLDLIAIQKGYIIANSTT